MIRPFGRGPRTRSLWDLPSPWLLTTYVRHGMILQVSTMGTHVSFIFRCYNIYNHLPSLYAIDPEIQLGHPKKETIVFQPSIFQVQAVSFREGRTYIFRPSKAFKPSFFIGFWWPNGKLPSGRFPSNPTFFGGVSLEESQQDNRTKPKTRLLLGWGTGGAMKIVTKILKKVIFYTCFCLPIFWDDCNYAVKSGSCENMTIDA